MCDLLDLKQDQCRYPSGTGLPYDFCGKPKARGSYCAEHAALCYSKATLKDWRGLAGMIYANEQTIAHVGTKRHGRDPFRIVPAPTHVSPIDEVFANSRIGEKPLMERVL